MLDQKTLSILEFDKIRELVAGYANFSGGRDLALAMQPTIELEQAREWQAETREAVSLFETDSGVTIGGARDVRRAADNAMRGFILAPEDFLAIQATIIAGRNLSRQLQRQAERVPHLAAIGVLIEECRGIVSAITATLDERGEVLDSASPRLAKVRQEQRAAVLRRIETLFIANLEAKDEADKNFWRRQYYGIEPVSYTHLDVYKRQRLNPKSAGTVDGLR